jgi:hypothetical protein
VAVRAPGAGAAPLARGVTRAAVLETPLADCAFLAAVVVISVLPYIGGLGFYYDDYSFLVRMNLSHDQSLLGLYHAVRPPTGQRPLQALTLAALYRAFGLNPLGYHVFNVLLLVAVSCLLYLVLRELRLPRLLAVAVPLVYSTLPHYATNRFWPATFQITLSTGSYLLSLYSALRALRARPRALAVWLALAAAAAAGSLFSYEILFPLFGLALALVWWAARRSTGPVPAARRLSVGILGAAVAVAGVVKVTRVADQGLNGYQVGLQDGFLHHAAYVASGAIKLNVGTYLLAVPYVLWWIVRHRLSWANAGAAAAAGALAFAYLRWIGRQEGSGVIGGKRWRACVAVGIVAFVLGYAIFLTNDIIVFRSAGIDNRINAGAALGVAGIIVGATGWLVTRLARRRPAVVFAAVTACVVAVSVLIVGALGSFWTAAAAQQGAVVSAIRQVLPSPAPSTTVVLDGVCPEIGPAVVFAKQWDLRGKLQMSYHDPSIAADVATESLRAGRRALVVQMTFFGERSARTYAYGPRLFVYEFRHRSIHVLGDRAAARRYISAQRPRFTCPALRSFAWGFDPTRRLGLP